MTRDLVAWFGPVARFQAPEAYVHGAMDIWFGCTGDGSTPPKCLDVAYSLGYGTRAMLPAIIDKAGMQQGDVGRVILAAFSAGGQVIRRILENAEDRARVSAVMLSDALYADWASAGVPNIPESWIDFGIDAISKKDKMFVATSSPSPNYSMPNGVQVIRELRNRLEQKTGVSFKKLDRFFDVEPQPEAAYQFANCILAEYPMDPLGHNHAQIAGQVWKATLLPFLAGTEPPGPIPPVPPGPGEAPAQLGPYERFLALAGGVVLGYLLAREARRRR